MFQDSTMTEKTSLIVCIGVSTPPPPPPPTKPTPLFSTKPPQYMAIPPQYIGFS